MIHASNLGAKLFFCFWSCLPLVNSTVHHDENVIRNRLALACSTLLQTLCENMNGDISIVQSQTENFSNSNMWKATHILLRMVLICVNWTSHFTPCAIKNFQPGRCIPPDYSDGFKNSRQILWAGSLFLLYPSKITVITVLWLTSALSKTSFVFLHSHIL